MEQVFLSLGSNLGDRLANLRHAIDSVREFADITALSRVYETEPVEFTAQPWFLNAVVALRSEDPSPSAPARLLERLLAIEITMGRERIIRKGPRLIDLDILLYGNRVIHDPALTIPHPAMHQRRFVLQPLADIAPAIQHPVLQKTALQLLHALNGGPQVRDFAAFDVQP